MTHAAQDPRTLEANEHIHVLLVDDDPILTEFAMVHLATPTTEIASAVNGEAAWDLLQAQSFDIVLLDIEMPVLDGFALLERLRADSRFVNLPVVMLTGRDDIASIDRAFQLGANSFVTKPINWRQLIYSLLYVLRTTRIEADLLRERKRSAELLHLTNNLLSLLKIEARTPLAAIIGFSDCIKQQINGPIGDDEYLKYAEQIEIAARQLQDSLSDLIQYAQLTSGAAVLSHDEYLASRVLEAAVAELPAMSTLRSVIEIEKREEDFALVCDLRWLARALRHLLEIATNEGGADRIEFAARRGGDGEARLMIRTARTTGSQNQPPSMTKSRESVRRDLGVGAPFAQRIAELHDGELVVTSRDDASITEIIIPARRVVDAARGYRTGEAA